MNKSDQIRNKLVLFKGKIFLTKGDTDKDSYLDQTLFRLSGVFFTPP